MIELKNVTRRFGDAVAVDRINLTVETGEVCVLVGSSGPSGAAASAITSPVEARTAR